MCGAAQHLSRPDDYVSCVYLMSCVLFCSYMTDGGLGLYTRRLNRLPDSMAAVRETLHRNASSGQGDADR